jgi:hypothetical protein
MPSTKRRSEPLDASEVTDVTDAVEMPSEDMAAASQEATAATSEAVNDVMDGWASMYEACTRQAFDNLEQATNAWVEMQSLLWLWPLRLWNPASPFAPAAANETDGPGSDLFGKFFAGTTPPQPMQESARELMTLSMRSWSSMWAPWASLVAPPSMMAGVVR